MFSIQILQYFCQIPLRVCTLVLFIISIDYFIIIIIGFFQILPPHFQDIPNPFIDSALTAWHVGHDKPPPSSIVAHRQKAWDVPRTMSTYDMLLEASPNLSTRARLLAVATRESGVWLNVLPVSSLGLHKDNDVIRVAVGLCLGAPLCEPHHCLHCQAEVDSSGTHGLSCRYSKGHHPRHGTLPLPWCTSVSLITAFTAKLRLTLWGLMA